MPYLKPGETARFDCDNCGVEFELTFEPKARSDPDSAGKMDNGDACVCPFCGSQSISSTDGDSSPPPSVEALAARRKKDVADAAARGYDQANPPAKKRKK